MIKFKRTSLFAATLSTLFLFVFFSSVANAQTSSSEYNIYSPQILYQNTYSPQTDNSNIYTPKADQSNIYTLDQDLIDSHHPSLYESIHSQENNDNNSLLIVVDNQGNIISVIQLNNEAKNNQRDYQNK
ncbi:MAG: hypothetical protein P8Z35_11675 [Ignavibacteriaceae bacterium]